MDDVDAHLIERTLSSEPLLQGNFLRVQRDTVALPDGALASREYVRHPGAVMVVPLLDDGRVVMERQWRHPLQQVLLEFPAGKIDPGESTLACARRELREETGYSAREWAHATWLHNAAAYSDEGIDIWFARGLEPGSPRLDAGEFLETVVMSVGALEALASRGELTDAKTLVGLLWWQRWQAGDWALHWQEPARM
jgi:ADP-ribose pyrophosphatase